MSSHCTCIDPESQCAFCALEIEVERLREALRTIVTISKKCNCDAYGGPCGCGDRAGDIAEEALKNL